LLCPFLNTSRECSGHTKRRYWVVASGRSASATFLFYILLDGHLGMCNTFWQAGSEG